MPSEGQIPENLQVASTPEAGPQFKCEVWGWPLILITGVAMAAISWRKWPDLLVDFGQQAYIPWQITQGQVLYRDIHYLYGPLSSYLHAAIFTLFSPGIMTLAVFNLCLLAILAGLMFVLMKKLADPLTATLAVIAFLGVFAFGQYIGGGNFNFICAYVYELPHGIWLSFLNLYLFTRIVERPGARGLFPASGFLTGCIFLTKPEVFLAMTGALAVGFFLLRRSGQIRPLSLLSFAGAFLVPPLIAWLYFSARMSPAEGWSVILAPWLHISLSGLQSLPLYRWVMGTDALGANLASMLTYFVILALMAGGMMALARKVARTPQASPALWTLLALVIVLAGSLWHETLPLQDFPRALPLVLLAYGVFLTVQVVRQTEPRTLMTLVFVTFAFLLLLKMFFHVRVSHYGFALALPATLVLTLLLVHRLPETARLRWGTHGHFRLVPLSLVVLFIVLHVHFENRVYGLKGYPVSRGGDMILDYHPFLDRRGEIVNAALDYIAVELPEKAMFASFPDAIMLNFLARRSSPLANINLNPAVWSLEGEDAILSELKATKPPYIVLVDQKFPQFGQTYFGRDFGRPVSHWIQTHYTLERQFGDTPFTPGKFGVQIMRYRTAPLRSH